jgi:hypothetical protein
MNEMNQYHAAYNILHSLAVREYMERRGHEKGVTFFSAEVWAADQVDGLTISEVIEWVQEIVSGDLHLSTRYDDDGELQIGLYY